MLQELVESSPLTEQETVQRARLYFLREDHLYGCAETTFMVLKEAFGLPEPADASAALALNGGVAYSGGMCGALSGAALAVGTLAGRRIPDHKQAKRAARLILRRFMDRFIDLNGSVNCRDLIGMEIAGEEQHHQFLESGIWRTRCMQQVELAVGELACLGDELQWQACLRSLPQGDGQG